jgi:hypothetical protein
MMGCEEVAFSKFKDELVEVFGWYIKRDGAGHFCDPGLIVATFNDMDFASGIAVASFCQSDDE